MSYDYHDRDDLLRLRTSERLLQERQDEVVSSAILENVEINSTPFDRLALANRLAFEAAKEPAIRRAAFEALRGCRNIATNGASHLAKWVRKNIRYAQEAPGVEILQGPYTTLSYQIGDCDDLCILWQSLCRASGLDVLTAGVAQIDDPAVLLHAVGYDAANDVHYELSEDWRYGGQRVQPLRFTVPAACYTVFWSPESWRQGFNVNFGSGYRPLEDGSMLRRQADARRMPNPYLDPGTKTVPIDSDGNPILTGLQTGVGGVFGMLPEIVASFLPGREIEDPIDEELPTTEVATSNFPTGVLALVAIAGAVGLVIYLVRRK